MWRERHWAGIGMVDSVTHSVLPESGDSVTALQNGPTTSSSVGEANLINEKHPENTESTMKQNTYSLPIAVLGCVLLLSCCAAMANANGPRVIVSDDFEQGIVKSVTYDVHGSKTGYRLHAEAPRLRAYLAGVDPADKSGIFAHTGDAASGNRSVRIQNAEAMNVGHLPALSWWLYQDDVVFSGRVKLAFDLKIPKNNGNNMLVLARGFRGPKGWLNNPKDPIDVNVTANEARLGNQVIPVTHGEWTRYDISIPVGIPNGIATMTVVDPELGSKTCEAALDGTLHAVDWIGLLLPGAEDKHLLLDNIDIKIVGEKPKPPKPSELPLPESRDDNAWAEAPVALLDIFPDSVVQFPKAKQGNVKQTSTYYPSGSLWQPDLDERWVFHQELKHQQDEENSFALRIGKGGQIYSLRGPFGESVPPSRKASPWNDEVWQFVAICGKYNDTLEANGPLSDDIKARIKATNLPRNHYFIHNSGAYMEGDLAGLSNLYCPMLAATPTKDGRGYRSVNWGLIPWNTMHRSPLLYYVQTRDAGDGVIELTWAVHNFSVRDDVVFDWLNAPWGGTRFSSLPFHYVSRPDGSLMDRNEVQVTRNYWERPPNVRDTGGWNLSSASETPDSPSLALVFGRDRHLEAELEKKNSGQPYCQFADSAYRDAAAYGTGKFHGQDFRECPENSFRNYDVAVVIPKFRLAPGTTIWYRSFLVVNRKDRAIELAKSLVDKVDYGLLSFAPETTPIVTVRVGEDGKVSRPTEETSGKVGREIFPAIKLFAHPVPGTKPLFLVEHETNGQLAVTTDMYTFFDKEKLDWDLSKDHPDAEYYNNAYAYRLEKHNSKWKRLLGYGYVDKPADDSYVQLSDLLEPGLFPTPTTYHLDLWVKP